MDRNYLFITSIIFTSFLVLGYFILNPRNKTPSVIIISPTNKIYYDTTQLLQIETTDNFKPDKIWYNWDGNNVTYISAQNITFNEGLNTIYAWTNDSAGKIGATSITFTISFSNFTSIWDTTKTSSSAENQVKLPLESGGKYDFFVDWGDNTSDVITKWNQTEVTHDYTSQGVYTIKIMGTLFGLRFNNGGDRLKLLEISKWGNLRLGNSGSYFYGCSNLRITASDILDLTGTTSLGWAFADCTKIYNWFSVNDWNVSNITNMANMYYGASNFNQDIGGWDVSRVIDMSEMFHGASIFNQDIGGWDVSRVKDMSRMFKYASDFNQDIGNWDLNGVSDMGGMFRSASNFNQDIGNWNVYGVTDMGEMFSYASSFNQDIGNWHVSDVEDMSSMFSHASAFNQDIGGWDVSNVESMNHMFSDVTLSTTYYDNLLIGWSDLYLKFFVSFNGGNSKYSAGTATTARQSIKDTYFWIITDGGQV